ncbi:MAG: hypothetical protein KDI79_07320 [Anaerolineae bacterium]|nr:hypothetical protein [Anaerolineae bacterium]
MVHKSLKEILVGLESELPGFLAAAVVGGDGLNIAQHTRSSQTPVENISAQMALFIKLVQLSVTKLDAGVIEDTLLTTTEAYLLIWVVPGTPYFLGVVVDRTKTLLGHVRLIGRVYVSRVASVLPYPEKSGDLHEQPARVIVPSAPGIRR